MSINQWPSRRSAVLLLIVLVLAAAGLSLRWVFLVPIYQSPDEPEHLDYALAIMQNHGLFRAKGRPMHFSYVHPYTHYLLDRSCCHSVIFNAGAKMLPGYGTRSFYQALDDGAAQLHLHRIHTPPNLVWVYPFGYYALLAAWLQLLFWVKKSLIVAFFGARILSVILLACSLALTYASLREMRYARGVSLLLTAIIGFFPMTTFVSSYVQPDNLSFTLVALCSYLTLVAKRKIGRHWVLALLGVAFGALLVTKLHYYICTLVPALAMLSAEMWWAGPGRKEWLKAAAWLTGPSLLLGLVYLWMTWGATNYYNGIAPHGDWTSFVLHGFNKAFLNYYSAHSLTSSPPFTSHQSFWGVFGWLDTPLIIRGERTSIVVRFCIQMATWMILALTLLRLEQVSSRIMRLFCRGRSRAAVRALVSNPLLNSLFLFTLFMFYFYIRLDNRFCAQGRNWLPYILPIFLTAVSCAPKALTLRRSRLVFSRVLLAGLVAYSGVGSYYALKTIRHRYYSPSHRQAMWQTPMPAEPVTLNQMTWSKGAGDGLGNDPFMVFALQQPQHVYAIKIKYVLSNAAHQDAGLQCFWKREGQNDFTDRERTVFFHLRARDTVPAAASAISGLPSPNAQKTLYVWINDTIDRFRIDPDIKPCHFEIKEMIMYHKPPARPAAAGA